MKLSVDVISDVIYRLGRAIAVLGEPVKVHWRPFQLNPTMPKGGNHLYGKENN